MFLLQPDTRLNIEKEIIKDTFRYYKIPSAEVSNSVMMSHSKNTDIPIGDIPYVENFLNKHYGIDHITALDIPEYLKTDEFLKRDYKIVEHSKLPKSGVHFIKDMSLVKGFAGEVVLDDFDINSLNANHLYQVSTPLDIQSEYRVYVIDYDIVSIAHYNGNPLIVPDMKLINKAVIQIYANEEHLSCYTLDVAVGKFGTAIIEIQNWISVGLYNTLFGRNLAKAYIGGIDYELNLHGRKVPEQSKRFYFTL